MSPDALGARTLPEIVELATAVWERSARAQKLVAKSDALTEAAWSAIAISKAVLARAEEPTTENDDA